MTGGGGDAFAAAGGPARHIPVLGRQAVDYLAPRDGGLYLDCTFGAGGYTRDILSRADCRVIGIDRDRTAIAAATDQVEAAAGRLTLAESNFSDMENVLRSLDITAVDGVVLDLGVSSMQLDTAGRGFSFRFDGPLDMRMGHDGPSVADVIARIDERDLSRVLHVLGEERHARAIARAVVHDRTATPFTTTNALASLIARVAPQRGSDIHPATRAFQALRILVNDELGELVAALAAAERLLRLGGRLAVVSFHSLEDRIVKQFLNDRGRAVATSRHQPEAVAIPETFEILTRRPVTPDDDEIAANPRARSAKLRAAQRTDAPAREAMPDLLPAAPRLADIMGRR